MIVTYLFLVLLCVFLLNMSSLLVSYLCVEFLTFLALLSIITSLSFTVSSSLAVIMFSVFVIGAVTGLIILINLVYFTGVDYIKVAVMSN